MCTISEAAKHKKHQALQPRPHRVCWANSWDHFVQNVIAHGIARCAQVRLWLKPQRRRWQNCSFSNQLKSPHAASPAFALTVPANAYRWGLVTCAVWELSFSAHAAKGHTKGNQAAHNSKVCVCVYEGCHRPVKLALPWEARRYLDGHPKSCQSQGRCKRNRVGLVLKATNMTQTHFSNAIQVTP